MAQHQHKLLSLLAGVSVCRGIGTACHQTLL